MFEHLPKEIMLVRIFDLKKCIWWITPKGKSQWSTVQDAQRAFSFHTKGDETTDSKLLHYFTYCYYLQNYYCITNWKYSFSIHINYT